MKWFAFSRFFRDADTGGSVVGESGVPEGAVETGAGEPSGAGAEDGASAKPAEPVGVGDEPIEDILGGDLGEGKPGEQGKEGKGEEKKEDKGAGAAEAVTADALKIPDGREYDQELGDSFLAVVNDAELSRGELAQKLLDMYVQQQDKMFTALSESEKATNEFLRKQEQGYLESSKSDPEFGGAGFEANLNVIRAGRDRLATPGAVEILQNLGIHNHPDIVRMFYRAGLLVSEDKSIGSGGSRGKSVSPAEAIFADSLKKK